MPRSSNDPLHEAELLRRFQEQLAGMGLGDMKDMLQPLMAGTGMAGLGVFEPSSPPSRRRDRRADVVTYRVRADLSGTKPPLWRRLELASDLHLDELHVVLQVAFGWTDSHLHRFGSGTDFYDRDTEYYLSPYEVEDGESGVPEHEVRLDEVLADVGDKLLYAYDFGDGWIHTLRLEAVLPRNGSTARAVCTGGRRPGPPEDCGGVPGYELHSAAADPAHPDHAQARAELVARYGFDGDAAHLTPTPFEIDAINEELAHLADRPQPADLPEPLADLLRSVADRREAARLQSLIGDAILDEPPVIDPDSAARMVRPYTWLLDRVGEDGIVLTGAGYLPPAHVEAAMIELGLVDEWIGKHNRESQTIPVLDLREAAQKAGLLRKNRGKLLLTASGRRLRTDAVRLWWHLAEQLPPKSRDLCEYQAGLLLLVAMAAGETDGLDAGIARTLRAVGWERGDGSPITPGTAAAAAWTTRAVLRRLGALTRAPYQGDERPTPEGVTFARAALRTWPKGT